MGGLNKLNELANAAKRNKYKYVPDHALVAASYNDSTANSLTRCIIDYITLNGGYAVRINTQGQYREDIKRFTKSTTRRGTADIHAVFNSAHYSIECKAGKDRMSEFQVKTKQDVERAGGFYMVAHNFDQWVKEFEQTMTRT